MVEEKVKKIMEEFKDFTDGIRVLFLIHRNKEGGANKGTKIKKYISSGKEEFETHLIGLLTIKENSEEELRIYSSVNNRNINKAIRKFKFNQLNADYYNNESRHGFYFDIRNRFISCLMTPSSRDSSFFLIDIDELKKSEININSIKAFTFKVSSIEAFLTENNINIIRSYPTKTGWHIITEPFNPHIIDVKAMDISIHKDGLLLLDY